MTQLGLCKCLVCRVVLFNRARRGTHTSFQNCIQNFAIWRQGQQASIHHCTFLRGIWHGRFSNPILPFAAPQQPNRASRSPMKEYWFEDWSMKLSDTRGSPLAFTEARQAGSGRGRVKRGELSTFSTSLCL